jgi:DNA-binding NtrC family response regulator
LRNVLERAVMLTESTEIHRQHLPLEKLTGRFASMKPPQTAGRAEARADSDRRTPLPPPLPSPQPPAAPAASLPPFSDDFTPTPGGGAVDPSQPRRRGLGLLASSQDRAALEARERKTIEDTLLACAGNQSRAAELLGISRRTLIKRIASYGIARPRKR